MELKFPSKHQRPLIYVISYAIFVGFLILLNKFYSDWGLNLNHYRDRAMFQGLTAIGIALFVFFQFSLDYRNRKRNVLYGEQVKAFMEMFSIVKEFLDYLPSYSIYLETGVWDIPEKFPIVELSEKYSKFMNSGKSIFIMNLLNRTPCDLIVKKEERHQHFSHTNYLLNYLKDQCIDKGHRKLNLRRLISLNPDSPPDTELDDFIYSVELFMTDLYSSISYELELL